ncbi:MAG TPA: hypothetical protein VFV73_18520 [Streptosporangiaceae bacterium]|nr:hypothetical protein [Streptosporangiaceae bacterium]
MRRNSSTIVVLAGQVPAEVLAAASRSMNVALYRPEPPDGTEGDDGGQAAPARAASTAFEASTAALQRAGRSSSPYALVPADPLAAVAARWREMWDLSRQPGPAAFEAEAALALAAWRAGRFELPDYYVVLGTETAGASDEAVVPDFYLGPLRSARPHRVVLVPATEPAEQAEGVLHALGSLRHGPWWPGLDQMIETARRFYPSSLTETAAVTLAGGPGRAG